MKIKTTCACRGNGKAYIKMSINGLSSDSEIELKCKTSAGKQAPALLYTLYKNKQNRELALVFPLAAISLTLFLYKKNNTPGNTLIYKKTIHPEILKWQSRFNYRFHREECLSIRDIEMQHFFEHPNIFFNNCIISNNTNVLRGTVHTSKPKELKRSLQIYDASFDLLETETFIMSESLEKSSLQINKEMWFIDFSVRIPEKIDNYTFIYQDTEKENPTNFASLIKEHYQEMLDDYSNVTLNASHDPRYEKWFEEDRGTGADKVREHASTFPYSPLISIVVPLYKTPMQCFNEMVKSVLDQTYHNFELILVNVKESNVGLHDTLVQLDFNPRIRVLNLEVNKGISGNTAEGIRAAKGEYVAFLDHDDVLEVSALFSYVAALNENREIGLLYCDEDKLYENGHYGDPYFKPDFSKYLLRQVNYICHFLMIKKEILELLEYDNKEFDGAQDHHLILQAIEQNIVVHHIAKVLYHWRVIPGSTAGGTGNKDYANEAARLAVQKHLDRIGQKASIIDTKDACRYKVLYEPQESPLVSIIIPNKDSIEVLDTCLKSIAEKSTYSNYEIIVVENNSTEAETFEFYETSQAKNEKLRVIKYGDEFNFSKIINFGVSHAKGEYYLLLNNDTEVITPTWIENMLGICQDEEVGAVGAKLYYRDGIIQHAGVCIDSEAATHINVNLDRHAAGYYNTTTTTRELSAVTGACLMTKKDIFNQVECFSEDFAVAFNDVDYCLKVLKAGKHIIYCADAELFHYESYSRGYETTLEKKKRFTKEKALLQFTWPEQYLSHDPYMNPSLSKKSPYHRLRDINE